MATAGDAVLELFEQFIRFRQTGTNRDEAWYAVLDRADHLTEKQVQRLLALAKAWEQREGNQYRYRNGKEASATQTQAAPPSTESVYKPLPPRQGRPASAPTGMLNPDVLRQIEEQAARNGNGVKRAPAAVGTAPIKEDTGQLIPVAAQSPSYFGRGAKVLMYFRDFPQELAISVPDKQEVIIGRVTPNSPMSPDVDLESFNAGYYGVSRMHASLQRRGETLLISDLDSRNGTFLNGERLSPHEMRALKDGDQISFAKLLTLIHFG